MRHFSHNTIVKRILFCFVCVVFFIPVVTGINNVLETSTAYAQGVASPEGTPGAYAATTATTPTTQTTPTTSGTPASPTSTTPPETGCDWMCKIGRYAGSVLLSTAAMITWATGSLLDYTILKLVTEFGDIVVNGGIGLVINDLWGIIRDLGNIVFIFGFIYIGIRTILQPESANTKSFLAQLVIAALLINFSLFFTKVVIDVANAFAVEVNELIVSQGANAGIGWAFAQQMGIASLYSPIEAEQLANLTTGGSVAFFVLGALFLLVAAFVFAAAAIMLIVRFIALIFIMIFSPLLFAAYVFPQTQKVASQLFSALLRYAFFAPVFLFLIYLSLRIFEFGVFTGVGTCGEFSNVMNQMNAAQAATCGIGSVFLQFAIAIGFMVGALMIAQKFSLAGGGSVVKFGRNLGRKSAGRVSSYIGRNMIGGTAERAERRYNRLAAIAHDENRSGRERALARAKLTGLAALTGSVTGRGARETFTAAQEAKFGGRYSRKDDVTYADNRRKIVTAKQGSMERESSIKNVDMNDPQSMEAFVKAVKDSTTDDLKEMDINLLTKEDVAVHLSSKQIEELEKTGKYSAADIGKIKAARKIGIKNIVDPQNNAGTRLVGTQTQRELLSKRGVDEIAKMPIEVFQSSEMRKYLTPAMVEAKMRAGGYTDAEFDQVETNIRAYVQDPHTPQNMKRQWQTWQQRSSYGARLNI